MRKDRFHPLLKKGELVMHDGRPHTVIRVTPSAAYLAPGDWRTDEKGGVLMREWNSLEAVSSRSAVERLP